MKTDSIPHHNIFESIETDDPGWGDESRLLLCPVCKFDYTHVDPPYIKDGGDNYEARWGGRGDLAVLPMWSECGSKWQVCVGFHKGQSAIFTRVIESCKDKASKPDSASAA